MVTSRTSSVITRAATFFDTSSEPSKRKRHDQYSPAESAGTSQVPMFAAKIDVCFVNSTTVITDTSELSLSSATKSLVIGANARRNACGPRTSASVCRSVKPACGPHRVVPAAQPPKPRGRFHSRRRRNSTEPDQCGQKSRELHDFGETELQDKQLEQECPDHLDIGGQETLQGRGPYTRPLAMSAPTTTASAMATHETTSVITAARTSDGA